MTGKSERKCNHSIFTHNQSIIMKRRNPTKLVCPLTEWRSVKSTRGRAVGKIVTTRIVLGADGSNWMIGIQYENGHVLFQKFYRGFKHLLPSAVGHFKLDGEDLIKRISGFTKFTLGTIESYSPNTLGKVGIVIDANIKSDFLNPNYDDIYERLLKSLPDLHEKQ
jgi:hypothetical protein